MISQKEIKNINAIEQEEFDSISKMLLSSLTMDKSVKGSSILNKKEELLDHFTTFLEKYLELHLFNSSENKLKLINFIDKLSTQKELLELRKSGVKYSEIELAGQRLGKKSQSAFETKL